MRENFNKKKQWRVWAIALSSFLLFLLVFVYFFYQARKSDFENQLSGDRGSIFFNEEPVMKGGSSIFDDEEGKKSPSSDVESNAAESMISNSNAANFPWHLKIVSTVFWIGEKETKDNDYISNTQSAWDDKWKDHYGGTDDPEKRNGFWPKKFKPKENPFYIALPYNDFDDKGDRRKNASQVVPWFNEKAWGADESAVKNRWVKIRSDSKIVYAQWEDSGPFEYNDWEYVFGDKKPKNQENKNAGIDISPAVRDYLGLKDLDRVDWSFVDFSEVPEGPWKEIITQRGTYWD